MDDRERIIRIANLIAGMVSLLITVLFPLGYFTISYRHAVGSIEVEAEINSRIFSDLINQNPILWQFEQVRLEELLKRRPGSGIEEIRRIVNLQNVVVAESADFLSYPLITRAYPLRDSGVTVGRIEISRSLSAIIADTGEIILFGIFVGFAIFAAMRTLPFRAILQAEDALRKSEERFRLILRNASDAVFVHEVASGGPGKVIKVNDKACEILGYDREELLRMEISDLDVPQQREKIPAIIHDLNKNGHAFFETEHVAKDGHRVPVEVNSRLIELDGKPFVLAVVRDTTERKRFEVERQKLQDQLQYAHKMESVGRLAGGVAHDYNNMLSVIIGYTELCLCDAKPGDLLCENLKKVVNAAQRSMEVTEQLLAFARKQLISPKVLDLNQNIERSLDMLRRLVGEDIDLTWIPGFGLWPVKMDPSQIDQILVNLCSNARDAIDGCGKISIETKNAEIDEAYCGRHIGSKPGRYVMVSISDDGGGMDKYILDNLFEPFFTTKEIGEGSGLGLPTVYGIVKQNEGYIDVYSEPGQGAVFRIYFPSVEESKVPHMEQPDLPRGGAETILLVEDEQMVLDLSKAVLERCGYKVLVTQSPNNAVAIAEHNKAQIDLLITDVIMPHMTGQQLKEHIEKFLPNLKTLFMSGYTADSLAHRGILPNDVYFLGKPFSNDALTKKVREVLNTGK